MPGSGRKPWKLKGIRIWHLWNQGYTPEMLHSTGIRKPEFYRYCILKPISESPRKKYVFTEYVRRAQHMTHLGTTESSLDSSLQRPVYHGVMTLALAMMSPAREGVGEHVLSS